MLALGRSRHRRSRPTHFASQRQDGPIFDRPGEGGLPQGRRWRIVWRPVDSVGQFCYRSRGVSMEHEFTPKPMPASRFDAKDLRLDEGEAHALRL